MKITINGTEYGIYWGLNTIDKFCEVVDMEMGPAIELLIAPKSIIKGPVIFAKFISCAINTYAKINDLPLPDVSYEKILVEIDSKGNNFTDPIKRDFFDSYIAGKNVAELLGIVYEETNKSEAKPKKKSGSRKSSS